MKPACNWSNLFNMYKFHLIKDSVPKDPVDKSDNRQINLVVNKFLNEILSISKLQFPIISIKFSIMHFDHEHSHWPWFISQKVMINLYNITRYIKSNINIYAYAYIYIYIYIYFFYSNNPFKLKHLSMLEWESWSRMARKIMDYFKDWSYLLYK